MVLLGGLATYIDPKSSPARVSMGITTVLTISTVIQGLKSQLPAVNYLTALDVYLWACFFFVSVTLIEYAYLNYQTVVLPADNEHRRRKGQDGDRMRALTNVLVHDKKAEKEISDTSQGRNSKENLHGRHLDGKISGNSEANSDKMGYPPIYEKEPLNNGFDNKNFDGNEYESLNLKSTSINIAAPRKRESTLSYCKFKNTLMKNFDFKSPDSDVENQSSPQYRNLVKKVIVWNRKQKNYSRTLEIDRYRIKYKFLTRMNIFFDYNFIFNSCHFRFGYAFSFISFNIIYWTYYLNEAKHK